MWILAVSSKKDTNGHNRNDPYQTLGKLQLLRETDNQNNC